MEKTSFLKKLFTLPPNPDVVARDTVIQAMSEKLDRATISIQAAADILTGNTDDDDATDTHYTGNPYPTYTEKVTALTRMYDGKKHWGNDVAKCVVDVRAAFLIGSGVQVIKTVGYAKSAERELKFIREFMKFNNLDEDAPQEWSKNSEIEGKALVILKPDKEKKAISAIYKPWYQFGYTIDTNETDYYDYIKARYTGRNEKVSFNLSPPDFVYKRFAGTTVAVNEPVSKAAMVLRDIQDLDKSMWDWRKINHLYASPTPVFEFEDEEVAKRFNDSGEFKNWRIGMGIIISNAKFNLACYSGEGYTTVKDEVEYHVRKISGSTGVPVHFFGYPDLLSNRDTAEALVEGIVLSTNKERKTWIGFYQELFRKAIIMYNENFQQDMNPEAINADIPEISSKKMLEIEKVWLPMYEAQAISLPTLLDQLATVEVDVELEKVKKERKEDEAIYQSRNSGNGELGNTRNGRPGNTRQNQGNRPTS